MAVGVVLRGDFQKLRDLISKMKEMESPKFRAAIAKNLAEETVRLAHDSFEHSRDPDGNPWKPITHRDGKPLLETGRLRNSIRAARITPKGFMVVSNVKYAAIHQYGGTIKQHARSELRGYSASRKGRQRRDRLKRVGLYSKKKAVMRPASIGERGITIPARPYLADARRLSPSWRRAYMRVMVSVKARWLRGAH